MFEVVKMFLLSLRISSENLVTFIKVGKVKLIWVDLRRLGTVGYVNINGYGFELVWIGLNCSG